MPPLCGMDGFILAVANSLMDGYDERHGIPANVMWLHPAQRRHGCDVR